MTKYQQLRIQILLEKLSSPPTGEANTTQSVVLPVKLLNKKIGFGLRRGKRRKQLDTRFLAHANKLYTCRTIYLCGKAI